jgi:hypothetical protein
LKPWNLAIRPTGSGSFVKIDSGTVSDCIADQAVKMFQSIETDAQFYSSSKFSRMGLFREFERRIIEVASLPSPNTTATKCYTREEVLNRSERQNQSPITGTRPLDCRQSG